MMYGARMVRVIKIVYSCVWCFEKRVNGGILKLSCILLLLYFLVIIFEENCVIFYPTFFVIILFCIEPPIAFTL